MRKIEREQQLGQGRHICRNEQYLQIRASTDQSKAMRDKGVGDCQGKKDGTELHHCRAKQKNVECDVDPQASDGSELQPAMARKQTSTSPSVCRCDRHAFLRKGWGSELLSRDIEGNHEAVILAFHTVSRSHIIDT